MIYTLLVSTLTGDESLSPANPPTFDPQSTPCWTGAIPEAFRKRPEAVRCLHPTHSVAAIGPLAGALTQDDLDSITPCDELSLYGKLAQREDACILLIGVDLEVNTTFHHVEEITGVDYHLQAELAKARIIVNGREICRHILLHKYGPPRDFNVMDPLLEERGIQVCARIGDAEVRLVQVKRMVGAAVRCVRGSRLFLCKQ